MDRIRRIAPELEVQAWLNTEQPISLESLRGRVVVIEAFQMLCPGCVSHGLPLLSRIAETFPSNKVEAIGLHCVFEHHEVQGSSAALEAFLHEYRIGLPVGIDAASSTGDLPLTMSAYGLRGTPSLIIIDQEGRQRAQSFGHVSDLAVGALLGQLLEAPPSRSDLESNIGVCTVEGCSLD